MNRERELWNESLPNLSSFYVHKLYVFVRFEQQYHENREYIYIYIYHLVICWWLAEHVVMGILVGFEGKSHGSGKEKAWVGLGEIGKLHLW